MPGRYADAPRAAKVRWHREFPYRPHSQGVATIPEGAVMISRVLSAELPKHIGERVTIAGWLHRRRELKSVTFLVIRDRAGLAQVVLPAGETARPARSQARPARRRSSRSRASSSPTRRRLAGPSSPSRP